jgi:hypothetical protein
MCVAKRLIRLRLGSAWRMKRRGEMKDITPGEMLEADNVDLGPVSVI